MFPLDDLEASDSTTDINAYTLRIFFLHLQPRMGDCKFAGGNRKLDKAGRLFNIFLIEKIPRIKAFHFACNSARNGGGVKERDRSDPRAARQRSTPSLFGPDAQRTHESDSSHNNTASLWYHSISPNSPVIGRGRC